MSEISSIVSLFSFLPSIEKQKAYIYLHFSVICWSFTAILGALIDLSAYSLVWWRVLLASLILLFLPRLWRIVRDMGWSMIRSYSRIGVLIALHWVCFYASIKLGNASIALITLATTSLFTAIMEPYLLDENYKWKDVFLGVLVIPAMMLAISDFDQDKTLAFIVGIASAFLLAYLTICNRRLIHNSTPLSITLIEMSSALVFLTCISPILYFTTDLRAIVPVGLDWVYLLILTIGCTIVPYMLHLRALKEVSAFTINLILNLEPVYGILLAIVILNDQKEFELSFYVGVLVIVTIVVIHPFLSKGRGQSKDIDEAH